MARWLLAVHAESGEGEGHGYRPLAREGGYCAPQVLWFPIAERRARLTDAGTELAYALSKESTVDTSASTIHFLATRPTHEARLRMPTPDALEIAAAPERNA